MHTPSPAIDFGGGDKAEFERQLRDLLVCLEELFKDSGLANLRREKKNHPAIALYDSLAQCVEIGRIPLRSEPESVAGIITLLLDGMTWARRDRQSSVLLAIEDEAAREYVSRNVKEPTQFDDVMAELHTCGWLKSRGFDAHLREDEAKPDIRIDGVDSPLWVEVKRISTASEPKRARKVIKDANKQLKNVALDAAGILFIHMRRENQTTMSDDVPSDVQPFINEAKRELAGPHSRSVAYVVVIWDDAKILDDRRREGLRGYVAKRQSRVLAHACPRSEPPAVRIDDLNLAFTVLMAVRDPVRAILPIGELRARSVPSQPISNPVVGQFYHSQNTAGLGVREAHAVGALQSPDAIIALTLSDIHVYLSTKSIKRGPKPYVLLVVASRIPGAETEIIGAYKLYCEPNDRERFLVDPLGAFLTLIERYGSNAHFCGFLGPFIPEAIAEFNPKVESAMIAFPSGDHAGVFAALAGAASAAVWVLALPAAGPFAGGATKDRGPTASVASSGWPGPSLVVVAVIPALRVSARTSAT